MTKTTSRRGKSEMSRQIGATSALASLVAIALIVGLGAAREAAATPPAPEAASVETRGETVLPLISVSATSDSAPLTEADVRRIVREEIATNPEFVIDALNAHVREQQEAEAEAADDRLLAQSRAITEDEGYPFVGDPEAPIEVFYYFDINCAYCKRIDADVREFVEANPDVRLVHREMPILAPTSRTAANIGGTLFALYPDAYPAFHDALMANEHASSSDDVEAALRKAAGDARAAEVISKAFAVTRPGIGREVDRRIESTLATARDAGISGTPFLFVGGAETYVRGAAPDLVDQLDAAADRLREQRK